jgi:hypothetical protein
MKKQIKDLELWEVDGLVAKAEEKKVKIIDDGKFGKYCMYYDCVYSPTTNPAQAWPIIERDRISIDTCEYDDKDNDWLATIGELKSFSYGKTSLEAAMKCYLVSVYGDEVEL